MRLRTASNTKKETKAATSIKVVKEEAITTGVVEELIRILLKINSSDKKIMRKSRNSLNRPSR